jgi:hypothetical protein
MLAVARASTTAAAAASPMYPRDWLRLIGAMVRTAVVVMMERQSGTAQATESATALTIAWTLLRP